MLKYFTNIIFKIIAQSTIIFLSSKIKDLPNLSQTPSAVMSYDRNVVCLKKLI